MKKYEFTSADYVHGKSKLVIPGDFVYIAQEAFSNDCAVKKIEFTGKISAVNYRAFFNCKKLNTIVLPNSCTVIRSQAFAGCTNLTKIILPQKLVRIEEQAFKDCKRLAQIEIPDTVKNIEHNAFEGCPKLCVKIRAAKIQNLHSRAFNKIRSLDISPKNNFLKYKDGFILSRDGSVLFSYIKPLERIAEFKIPKGVKIISKDVFSKVFFKRKVYVGRLVLPESIEEICSNAFSAFQIRDVVEFGKNLKKIHPFAFSSGTFDFALCPNVSVLQNALPKYAYCSCLVDSKKIENPLRCQKKNRANPLHILYSQKGSALLQKPVLPQNLYDDMGGANFSVRMPSRRTYFCRELMRPFYLYAKSSPRILDLFDEVSYQNILHFFWAPKISPKFWQDYPQIAAAWKDFNLV